ncbi:MAG: hypothetical protein ACYDAG_02500 [Chloroflexota bacterium]
MSPAEKAKATRERNKIRAAHQAALDRYAGRNHLRRIGVTFGVGAINQRCETCQSVTHSVNIFRDENGQDVRVCDACVTSAQPAQA